MDIKANVYDLMFEVTRRCNLRCEHCLRGEAENLDMSQETVGKVLDCIESIGSLVLTGGEPTLNMPLVNYIFSEIRRRKIPLSSFYVVTNGIENQMELTQTLLENIPYCNDPDMCGVAISKDIYHDNTKEECNSPVHYLSFYQDDKENGDFYSGKGILRRGRAASDDFVGGRIEDPNMDLEIEVGTELYIGGTLYVSASGEICADCNLSYDMMKDYLVTTVDKLPEFLEEKSKETAAA